MMRSYVRDVLIFGYICHDLPLLGYAAFRLNLAMSVHKIISAQIFLHFISRIQIISATVRHECGKYWWKGNYLSVIPLFLPQMSE